MLSDALHQDLVEQIVKGNVVLFLGAGLPLSGSHTPDEHDLVAELIKYCDYHEPDRSFAKVAEYYVLSLGRQSLEERVSNWTEQRRRTPSPLDLAIAQMPFNIVVTTRTDLMLIEAYRQMGKSVTKVVRDGEIAFNDQQRVSLSKL